MSDPVTLTRRDFREVRTVLVDKNPGLRSDMRSALVEKGIREPITCKNVESFLDVAGKEVLDLIVCDASTFGPEFSAAMQRIRRNALGGNPFVVVIATLQDASLAQVQNALNGGVDDLMRRPAPSKRIVDRIDYLVKDRKPFVTTSGYVGPTRRSFVRPDDEDSELLRVPNTLRSKVVDKVPDAKLKMAIQTAVIGLAEKMNQNPLSGIDRLIHRALSWEGGSGEELRRDFTYLYKLALEMSNHYRGTAFDHIADLAMALANLSRRIAEQAPTGLRQIDLDLLSNLGAVIRSSIAVEEQSDAVIHEIASTVGRYVVKDRPRASVFRGTKH
jgi:DNA-binding response OmpR family regulator